MTRSRNPYRPGTVSHARFRQTELKRRKTLAASRLKKAKSATAVRQEKQRISQTRRALHKIEAREEFRKSLNEKDRREFDAVSIKQQEQLQKILKRYPDGVPSNIPDPFKGSNRNQSWRLYYATRAGLRQRAKFSEAA